MNYSILENYFTFLECAFVVAYFFLSLLYFFKESNYFLLLWNYTQTVVKCDNFVSLYCFAKLTPLFIPPKTGPKRNFP